MAAGTATALSAPRFAFAANFPVRPVTIVVPLAPGGSADGIARLVAQGMTRGLGQPVVVENKAGAGGSIGASFVAKSRADGHTLLYATSSHSANMSLYKPAPFDLLKDFAPVTILARPPLVMAVNSNLPVSNVPEFISWAKALGRTLNYGSAGSGTNSHMAAALFSKLAALPMQHIPFKGGAPAILELMAGRIEAVFSPMVEVLQHVESGKLKVLGMTGPARSPRMPQAAPIADTLPGYDIQIWHGLMAPAGTDPAIVAQLAAEANKSLLLSETRRQLAGEGTEVVGSTPQAFAAMLPADIVLWAGLVKLSGAVVE